MPKKELSPYAPDRWIRELNGQNPNILTELRKLYEHPEIFFRKGSEGMDLMPYAPE